MVKVLYISYDGLTDPLGQSQVLPYLQQLSLKGFRFTIISFEKKERLAREKEVIRQITAAAGIEWVPLSFTSRPPVLAKIWDRFRLWKKAHSLYRKNRYQLIHCRSYVAAEVGLKLKKKYGAKFLFDMRGFWADEKVDNGQWNLNKPFYRYLYKTYKAKEKQFLLQADGIVSLTRAASTYLHAQPGYESLPIEVIPCCADLSHFDYQKVDAGEAAELRSELGLQPGDKLITYLGSVGGWYMTSEMFRFYKALSVQHPEFKMLLLTKDDPAKVKAEAAAIGVRPEDLFVLYSDRKTLPLYLAISDFSIFFIRNSFSKKASSPTKHAELMGMGVPVICNDIGDTGNIIRETGSGVVLDDFSDNSFREMSGRIKDFILLDKKKIRDAAIEKFDLVQGARLYEQLYRRILNLRDEG